MRFWVLDAGCYFDQNEGPTFWRVCRGTRSLITLNSMIQIGCLSAFELICFAHAVDERSLA